MVGQVGTAQKSFDATIQALQKLTAVQAPEVWCIDCCFEVLRSMLMGASEIVFAQLADAGNPSPRLPLGAKDSAVPSLNISIHRVLDSYVQAS